MNDDVTRTNLKNTPVFSDPDGEKMALELFHEMADRVPAYKDFLAKNNVDPAKVQTYEDFQANVPLIDKKNYISQYPLADLCFDGNLFHNDMISVSSGSTGVPFFWPRGPQQDVDNTEAVTRIFDGLEMNKKKTLLVLCFSLGTWVAGTLIMTSAVKYAEKGNPVSVLTPGIEKKSAIDVVMRLAEDYDQVVLGAYPPFAKDLIEEGARAGIDWAKLNVKLVMGGEGFSEEWRDYVLELVSSHNVCTDAVNIFGLADVGLTGYETPTSIAVRRAYNANPAVMSELFGAEVLPSIVQYDPAVRHFEKVGDELVVSSNSGIPLTRYNLKDTGGLLSYENITAPVLEEVTAEAQRYGVELERSKLPFVYLNGRKDFAITIYGVNVYPENIKAALIDPRVRSIVTGRFTMATKTDENMDQSFEVNVELMKDVVATTTDQDSVEAVITETLMKVNNEFSKLYESVDVKARPLVRLVAYGDQAYFARGIKHKWSKKDEK